MRRLWIGIDPGERWNGYAVFRYNRADQCWQANTGVIDAHDYPLVERVRVLLDDTYRSYVVAEEFQARRAFIDLSTARMLGALQYATESHDAVFQTVRAGDPDKELDLLGLGLFVAKWGSHWPTPSAPQWHHARSAWRVLGQWFLQHDPEMMQQFQLRSGACTIKRNRAGYRGTIHAPTIQWPRVTQLALL